MIGKSTSSEVFTIVKEEGIENAHQSNATNFCNSGNKLKLPLIC
jgi:hypothetical protein